MATRPSFSKMPRPLATRIASTMSWALPPLPMAAAQARRSSMSSAFGLAISALRRRLLGETNLVPSCASTPSDGWKPAKRKRERREGRLFVYCGFASCRGRRPREIIAVCLNAGRNAPTPDPLSILVSVTKATKAVRIQVNVWIKISGINIS